MAAIEGERPAREWHDTSSVAAVPKPPQAAVVAQDFSGTWDMDKAASDDVEPAMDALRMNFLVRKGAGLVRGLSIKQDGEDLEMTTFSALPGIRVVERYPLSGEERRHKRRDQQRGKLTGRAEVLPDGRVQLQAAWGDPHCGTTTNTFSRPAAGALHVDVCLKVGERTVEYRTVFKLRE